MRIVHFSYQYSEKHTINVNNSIIMRKLATQKEN